MHPPSNSKPRITLLADTPNWAFGYIARSIAKRLQDEFQFCIKYVHQKPHLDDREFDLIYIFYWGEEWHRQFNINPNKIVREVASYRWKEPEYGQLSVDDLFHQHLNESVLITTPAHRLWQELSEHSDRVFLCPNGFEGSLFHPRSNRRTGNLSIGWSGNPKDPCKGLHDILIPACDGRFQFTYTPGNWSRTRVAKFYNSIDVLAVSSTSESQPLPLVEAMACGCFPVAVDVGIVPEVIVSGVNGLVIDRSVESFQRAFSWCRENLDLIREIGAKNAQYVAQYRTWDQCTARFRDVFRYALSAQTDKFGYLEQPPAPEVPAPTQKLSGISQAEYLAMEFSSFASNEPCPPVTRLQLPMQFLIEDRLNSTKHLLLRLKNFCARVIEVLCAPRRLFNLAWRVLSSFTKVGRHHRID